MYELPDSNKTAVETNLNLVGYIRLKVEGIPNNNDPTDK